MTPTYPRPCRALVALGVVLLVAGCGATGAVTAPAGLDPVADVTAAGRAFLDSYVDPDGRVVRRDESGDTVSEGQAYALLIAVALGDRQRFGAVWGWTRQHLRRPDGLLSWRWADGRVIDRSSATDADLDTARALLLAGERFADPGLTAAGAELGAAVLAGETVRVGTSLLDPAAPVPPAGAAIEGTGLLVSGGSWSATAPAAVNPSYFSPRTEALLGSVTGDPRWAELTRTQRAFAWQLVGTGRLPPDWVTVDIAGTATPRPHSVGGPPHFGLDAARLPVRMAESCDAQDRAVAAKLLPLLDRPVPVAAYSLDGDPQVGWRHPLALVALAAAAEAAGDESLSDERLAAATQLNSRKPTYYGAAWTVLGRILLDTELLGGCR